MNGRITVQMMKEFVSKQFDFSINCQFLSNPLEFAELHNRKGCASCLGKQFSNWRWIDVHFQLLKTHFEFIKIDN